MIPDKSPEETTKKNKDGFKKAKLSIDNFPDLPVGIIVCKPIRSETGSATNFLITYCNSFASALFTSLNSKGKAILLDEIPELKTFLKPAFNVLETGISCSIESHEQQKGYWLDVSINRTNGDCIIYLQKNTISKEQAENGQRRLQLESIISVIASRLKTIPSTELDAYIVESLAQIATYKAADRVYIFNYSMDEKLMNCAYEWCAKDVGSFQEINKNVDTSLFPWWHQKIINQETILLQSLDDLPANAIAEKMAMERQGTQSLLVVPMVFDNKYVGFIGFDSVKKQRNWGKSDTDLLMIFSKLIVTATERIRREQLLQRTDERLAGLSQISHALTNTSLIVEQPDLTVLKHIFDMIPCEVGIVFRIDETGQFAYAENRMQKGTWEAWPKIRVSVKYFHYETLSQGREVLINELQDDTTGFPTDFNPYNWGHRSFLAISLFAHQQYIGLLILLDKSPDFFTQEYVFIAREVAGQLSILLFQEKANQQLIKQADKLNESNQFLQAVIDNIPVGLVLWKPIRNQERIIDFTYLLINPVSAALVGLDQAEMVGKSFITLFPHVVQNGLFDLLVNRAESGKTQRFQFLDKLPMGDFWGDFSLVWLGDNLLLTVSDISHLKQIEAQLQQTNLDLEQRVAGRTVEIQQLSATQQAILKYTGLAIAVSDVNGLIQLVNPALETLTGYAADELIGKATLKSLRDPKIHQHQINQLKPKLNRSFPTEEELIAAYVIKHGFLQRENTLLTKQRQRIPVLSTVSGLFDDNGKLVGFVDVATDISNLKTVELALTQANQRNQLATRAGKLGVWEWSLLTNELVLDKNFFSLFGMAKKNEGLRVTDFEPLVHPDDLLFLYQHIQQAIEKRTPLDVEFRVILPSDKSVHYIKADGLILQNEQGRANRIIGVIRDQTAAKRADQALKESEIQYRSLVNHLKEVVFQIDLAGLWIYLNPAWQEVSGFTVNESIDKQFLDYVFPEDRELNRSLYDRLIAQTQKYCEHSIRYIHKDGGYRWIDVFAQVTLDKNNEVSGITGTLTDSTERKKAAEDRLESEQRFRDIAENVDEIFWIRDIHEPKFIYMNSAYEKFSGQKSESLYENPFQFLNFILEEDRHKVANYFVSKDPDLNFQFRARHQDGSIRYLNVRLFTVKTEQGELIRRIGMATDVTASFEKESILEESLKKERDLNALKSQFISTASHEFKTPLATISTSIELIKHYVNENEFSSSRTLINKHLDKIYQKVFSLNDLITDTLTISKIDEGKVEFNPQSADLISFCEDIVKMVFADRADNRHVDIVVIGKPTTIKIDKKLMEHVLVNLLSNAFKFSTKNPALEICFDKYMVVISVKDEGIGIPTKDIPNLFGKFFRASNAQTFQGTGLGLAICQEYISLQNGRIDMESTEGVGTTFKITLPVIS